MLKALADRLAEAFAERMHQRVRTEFWGYATDEGLSATDLIAEKYRGIRPAPGYPACPDHTVKAAMFEALQGAEIGMSLTESWAMTPAASVSGFYIAHPDAAYFNVGKIGEDQIEDWARRTQQDAAQVRRSLAALLVASGCRVLQCTQRAESTRRYWMLRPGARYESRRCWPGRRQCAPCAAPGGGCEQTRPGATRQPPEIVTRARPARSVLPARCRTARHSSSPGAAAGVVERWQPGWRRCGGLTVGCLHQRLGRHRRHFDLQIDAVEQGTADARLVTAHRVRRAATGFQGAAMVTAGTWIHGSEQLKAAGNSAWRAAREMMMRPVSSGSRSASSAILGNSGSSSRNSTPS